MSKVRTCTFDITSEELFKRIENMIFVSAKEFIDTDINDLDINSLNYEYGNDNEYKVYTTEVIINKKIVYRIEKKNYEKYEVSFVIDEVDSSSTLSYSVNLVTDISKIAMNYSIMQLFYSRKEKKSFNQMCEYLRKEL